MRTLIAVLVLGCGGSKPAPTTAPANNEPTPAVAAGDPSRKPTEAECAAALDKALAVMRADPELGARFDDARTADKRARGMDDCRRDWTGGTTDCLMAATTVAALDGCVKGRTHTGGTSTP